MDRIDPYAVRFSQASIGYRFKNGTTIDELAQKLRDGSVPPSEVPPVRLVERNSKLFTLDNRRLEAFRRAGIDIPYVMASAEDVSAEGWKFTTLNDGISVRVRGEPE